MGESTTADGVTLTMFAREHVDPLFRRAGARKKGRRYEFANAAGDVSLFDLYSRGWRNGTVGFDAGCQISPHSMALFRQWSLDREGGSPAAVPRMQVWLWSAGLTPPLDVEQIGLGHRGFFDAASARRCGEALAAAIASTVIPLLVRSMDRRWLLDAFLNGDVFRAHRMIGTPERTRVLLLIDDGASPDLDRALADLAASTRDPRTREGDRQLLRWARERLDLGPAMDTRG
ncbi:hypothetical protein [Jatrophihabitans endophyticus]|nr:hypothetical protein [Jatrophihabitans endophyticus]